VDGPQGRGYNAILVTGKSFGERPPRLERIFQSKTSPVYFVTFCTHERKPWLACASVHEALVLFASRAAADFNTAIGRYVIMPDHVHLFVCGGPEFVLGKWIAALKQALARGAGKTKSEGQQLWQEGFFDHLLRSDESMSQKWEYIRQNPVRAGLVPQSEGWPYQGEIVPLDRV